MTPRHLVLSLIVLAAAIVAAPQPAAALPTLQLYAEGATYNATTETWEASIAAGDPLRIWAIGNVDGPGGVGAISNVRLAISYDADADSLAGGLGILLTPTDTGGFGGYTDPSVPAGTGTQIGATHTSGTPTLGDGSSLANHGGVYDAGRHWQEFALGNFTLTDSPIGNFEDAFPAIESSTGAQINVYEVWISNSGTDPTSLHFDLYDTYVSGKKVKADFAPFSHDAEGDIDSEDPDPGPTPTPELGSLGVWGLFAVSAAVARLRRRRR